MYDQSLILRLYSVFEKNDDVKMRDDNVKLRNNEVRDKFSSQ